MPASKSVFTFVVQVHVCMLTTEIEKESAQRANGIIRFSVECNVIGVYDHGFVLREIFLVEMTFGKCN